MAYRAVVIAVRDGALLRPVVDVERLAWCAVTARALPPGRGCFRRYPAGSEPAPDSSSAAELAHGGAEPVGGVVGDGLEFGPVGDLDHGLGVEGLYQAGVGSVGADDDVAGQ
jgi:hypothetical protein